MYVNFCGCVTYVMLEPGTWNLTCVLIRQCHFTDQQQGPSLIRADEEALLPLANSTKLFTASSSRCMSLISSAYLQEALPNLDQTLHEPLMEF